MNVRRFDDNSSVHYLLLIATVAAAAFLRFYNLGDWSLWQDEAYTINDSIYAFEFRHFFKDLHSRPLNFWLTKLLFSAVPVSEWSARLIPSIAGVVTIPVVYLLSRRFLDRTAALLLTVFLAFSAWHLYWSQNARGYSLLLLLSFVSLSLFYIALERESRLYLFSSLIILGLAYLAHPVALLLGLALCAYLVLIPISGVERPAGYKVSVLWVFVAPVVLLGLMALPGFIRLAHKVLQMSDESNSFYVLASVSYYVHPFFMVLGGVGTLALVARRSRLGLYMFSLMGVPMLSLLVISNIRGGSALYVFHTLPIYYMASAVVLSETMSSLDGKQLRLFGGVLVLSIVALQSVGLYGYYTHGNGDRPRFKEAAEYIGSVSSSEDVIASSTAPVLEYYLGPGSNMLRRPERVIWLDTGNMGKLVRTNGRTWLVVKESSIDSYEDGPFGKWLHDHCANVKTFKAWTNAKDRSITVFRCRG